MENKIKDRAYLLVIAFSLMMCLMLLYCMVSHKPVLASVGMSHLPPRQTENEEVGAKVKQQDRMMITEEYFSKMLSQYLPSGFPVQEIDTEIEQNGKISVSASVKRTAAERYLEDNEIQLSMKQKFLVLLLPKTFRICVTFQCSVEQGDRLLLIVPEKISLNDSNIMIKEMPATLLDSISAASNSLLAGIGYYFTDIRFMEGAIELTAND